LADIAVGSQSKILLLVIKIHSLFRLLLSSQLFIHTSSSSSWGNVRAAHSCCAHCCMCEASVQGQKVWAAAGNVAERLR
jgi:hypothetical protein